MVEGDESGGPENRPGSKPAPLVEAASGRVRFRVELKPGETTIVSWKKLLREANLTEPDRPGPSIPGPTIDTPVAYVSEPPPASHAKETTETETKESQANRLSNVIERIERMYAGNDSSDEEDLVLDNMPDDDEYDTEDSFIDDTDLDDYFQVDNSMIKHDGFFVNRGKLEQIDSTISMDQQPKKRRGKDMAQGGGSEDGLSPHKIMKKGNKGIKASSSIPRGSTNQFYKDAVPKVDMLVQDSAANTTSGLLNSDAIRQDVYKDTSTQRSNVSKSLSGKLVDNVEVEGLSIQRNEKGGIVERLNLKVAASQAPFPTLKEPLMEKKEGSSVRPKSTDLEKAFKELEKIVEQFRPPSAEPQDLGNQAQPVKRRLPPEIKMKLAKVARVAGSIYGRIPKDVINRLMSILGHLMQITTLKRNLRTMANMALSAKQEKEDQIQKMKQEVAEMVKLRIVRMKSKDDAHSDDFQEACLQEREALKCKYRMDNVLENKICDLYDLYIERVEEDSGPPVRKLYEELALFWPSGFMDTDGIKRAIYRAKDRRGRCSSKKDRDKIKKKVVEITNTREEVLPGSTLVSNSVPIAANGSNPKQEKAKKSIGSSNPKPAIVKLPKSKVKRKPSSEVVEAKLRLDKPVISETQTR